MHKKITLIILAAVVFTVASSCANRRDVPPRETPAPRQKAHLQREDRLAKTDKEAVEENINGFSIEEDLRLTQKRKKGSKNSISSLSQEQKKKILENIVPKKFNTVLYEYNTTLPETINNAVQYLEYSISHNYLLVTAEDGADIRTNPIPDAAVVNRVENLDKISLLQKIEGEEMMGSNIWYRVASKDDDQIKEGYIHSTQGLPRSFRFDRMEEAVNRLRQQIAQGSLHFVSNYKNQNGAPPQKGDAAVDEHGYRVYHSAPAYERADTDSEFRYIPDGMLLRILNETDGFYHINVPDFGGNFYIPKQYINPDAVLSRLNHVVVVDRNQQNQASFEIDENGLNLVSYTLATTGFPGNFSFETTLGNYKALEKRERFEYLENKTEEIAGYAPYAIRFTGGAYIHGVPVAYEEQNGKKIDPGYIEYLHTIGTFPRSNMCVRNFTSHAKFLYNWMDTRNGAVIIIE